MQLGKGESCRASNLPSIPEEGEGDSMSTEADIQSSIDALPSASSCKLVGVESVEIEAGDAVEAFSCSERREAVQIHGREVNAFRLCGSAGLVASRSCGLL